MKTRGRTTKPLHSQRPLIEVSRESVQSSSELDVPCMHACPCLQLTFLSLCWCGMSEHAECKPVTVCTGNKTELTPATEFSDRSENHRVCICVSVACVPVSVCRCLCVSCPRTASPLLSLCSPFAPPLRLVSLFAALILFCFVRARAAECIVPAPTPPPPPTRVDESSSTAEIDDVWIYVIVALAAALVLGLVFIAYRRQGRVRPQTQTHTAGPLSLLESVAKRCCNCSFRNEFVGLVFLSFGPDCPRSFLIRLPPLLQLVCFAFVLFLYICHPLATYRLKCMWLGPYQRWKPAIQQRGASSNKLGEQRGVFVLFFFFGGGENKERSL